MAELPKNLSPLHLEALKNAGILTEKEVKQQQQSKCEQWLERFVTVYPAMIRMKERARVLSTNDKPVLIYGETGTGKELIAHALHGDRPDDKFIAINCAAMPEALMESMLFGHVAGAFTDAKKNRTGLLELANGGTMFMDEIGDLAVPLQAKLLRALQERKIRPVGADSEREITCRFVFATHHDLIRRTAFDLFRQDLYYRISTFILRPASLKERSKDILPIVEEIDSEARIHSKSLRGVSLEEFCARIKPDMLDGNVRSLQQIVERYLVLGLLPGEE